jgi:putative toxin-antitoxin system antitoxin component (TIGR02293 family)
MPIKPRKAPARDQRSSSDDVVTKALEDAKVTVGSEQKAWRWLRRPTSALDGALPLDVLANDEGARVVADLLGRIDHGLAV